MGGRGSASPNQARPPQGKPDPNAPWTIKDATPIALEEIKQEAAAKRIQGSISPAQEELLQRMRAERSEWVILSPTDTPNQGFPLDMQHDTAVSRAKAEWALKTPLSKMSKAEASVAIDILKMYVGTN